MVRHAAVTLDEQEDPDTHMLIPGWDTDEIQQ
jgi:hypothetical protein